MNEALTRGLKKNWGYEGLGQYPSFKKKKRSPLKRRKLSLLEGTVRKESRRG